MPAVSGGDGFRMLLDQCAVLQLVSMGVQGCCAGDNVAATNSTITKITKTTICPPATHLQASFPHSFCSDHSAHPFLPGRQRLPHVPRPAVHRRQVGAAGWLLAHLPCSIAVTSALVTPQTASSTVQPAERAPPCNPACSLWDFLLSDNSELIKCNGEACVVDYVSALLLGLVQEHNTITTRSKPCAGHRCAPSSVALPTTLHPTTLALSLPSGPQFNDDQLKWGRLDFIKLADLEQVQAFVQAGTDYAERTDAASECWSRTASVDSILCPSGLARTTPALPRPLSLSLTALPARPPCLQATALSV